MTAAAITLIFLYLIGAVAAYPRGLKFFGPNRKVLAFAAAASWPLLMLVGFVGAVLTMLGL